MKTNTVSLTADEVISRILNTKGSYVKAYWKSNPKPAAAHKSVLLEKVTGAVVRSGIDFSNLGSVKEGIESGDRGEVQPLPWGQWKMFPYVIEHKDTDYIRLYPSLSATHIPQTTYYVNGSVVNKSEFASYLTASESNKLLDGEKSRPECFTVKADNIIGTEEYIEGTLA